MGVSRGDFNPPHRVYGTIRTPSEATHTKPSPLLLAETQEKPGAHTIEPGHEHGSPTPRRRSLSGSLPGGHPEGLTHTTAHKEQTRDTLGN